MLDQSPSSIIAPPSPARPWGKVKASTVVLAIVFVAVVFYSIRDGLALRSWMYPASVEFRFRSDIDNAWSQGTGVMEGGRLLDQKVPRVSFGNLIRSYLGRYDAMMDLRPDGDYGLDYPPARLLIMSVWVWRETDGGAPRTPGFTLFGRHFGKGEELGTPAELAGPLTNVNTVFELLAMAGAFMLARAVLRRDNIKYAEFIALVPALLVWFNPALLLNAHVWPQWDAWPLPFWLWACYFAVTRRWLAAGFLLGLGGMFKGQIYVTAAFFVLWPLFQWRLRAVLEVSIGILLGAMVFVSPWMLSSMSAKVVFGVIIAVTLALLPWIRRGWRILALSGSAGVTLLLVGLLLGGSFGWWHIGFEYGARRWQAMNMGPTPNLAASLQENFGLQMQDVVCTVDWAHPAIHADITVQETLTAIYVLGLVLCAVGAAIQDSRKDRRLLLAMATPWLVMFAFLPQMHERYLVWGAVLMSLAAAVSVGSTLLGFVLTFAAFVAMAMNMPSEPEFQNWRGFMSSSYHELQWVVVLVALIFVYLSLVGGPGRKIRHEGTKARRHVGTKGEDAASPRLDDEIRCGGIA